MRKSILVFVIIFSVGALAGCKKKNDTGNTGASPTNEMSGQENADNATLSGPASFIDNIRKGLKVECTYKTNAGEEMLESKVFVEGEKYRSMAKVGSATINSISDGKTVYSWQEGDGTGTKMEIDCLKDIGGSVPEEEIQEEETDPDYFVPSAEELFNNAADVDCKPVAKIDFTIPTNINFVDQCELIKQQMEALKKLSPQIPNIENLAPQPE